MKRALGVSGKMATQGRMMRGRWAGQPAEGGQSKVNLIGREIEVDSVMENYFET